MVTSEWYKNSMNTQGYGVSFWYIRHDIWTTSETPIIVYEKVNIVTWIQVVWTVESLSKWMVWEDCERHHFGTGSILEMPLICSVWCSMDLIFSSAWRLYSSRCSSKIFNCFLRFRVRASAVFSSSSFKVFFSLSNCLCLSAKSPVKNITST